jgi:DNA gyrase subunit A
MSAAEQFILTVSERGYGKRSSSYEYRITNRGGKGLVAMAIWEGKKGSETIKEKIGRWSPRSRWRRPTSSCWSPTAGS